MDVYWSITVDYIFETRTSDNFSFRNKLLIYPIFFRNLQNVLVMPYNSCHILIRENNAHISIICIHVTRKAILPYYHF